MASLDMSLDDMIKSRRSSERGRGQGRAWRGRGRGPVGPFRGGRMTAAPRRGPLSVNSRPSSYAIAKSFRRRKSFPWQRDLFEDSLRAAGLTGAENGTKLYVSNLDVGVTNEDIRELFSEIGDLKRYAVHYDRNGRSSCNSEAMVVYINSMFTVHKLCAAAKALFTKTMQMSCFHPTGLHLLCLSAPILRGLLSIYEVPFFNTQHLNEGSAEVVFSRRTDAFQALKRYNNVQLDGRPMKIEIIGTNSEIPSSARVNVVGGANGRRTVVMAPRGRGRGAAAVSRGSGQRGRGGPRNFVARGRGGRGGRGRGREKAVEKSAVELDKELDNYHAMQT